MKFRNKISRLVGALLGVSILTTSAVLVHAAKMSLFPSSDGWFLTSYQQRVWAIDFTGTGSTDLMGLSSDGTLKLMLSGPSGSYSHTTSFKTNGFLSKQEWFSTDYNQRVWPADVNGDGRADLVGVSVDGYISTLLNTSSSMYYSFQSSANVNKLRAFRSSEGWFNNQYNERVWVADINGDGCADIVGISETGKINYALAEKDGTFLEVNYINTNVFRSDDGWFNRSTAPRVWPVDIDGDGKTDFVGIADDGRIYAVLNTSIDDKISFSSAIKISGTSGQGFTRSGNWLSNSYTQRIWPADVNGDGLIDLVGIAFNGDIYYAASRGDGTFEKVKLWDTGTIFKTDDGWFNTTHRQRVWPATFTKDISFVGISRDGYIETFID